MTVDLIFGVKAVLTFESCNFSDSTFHCGVQDLTVGGVLILVHCVGDSSHLRDTSTCHRVEIVVALERLVID